jgi:hypothetical protein
MRFAFHIAVGVALAGACNAQTPGVLADVAIIDRDSGVALSPHYYRGEYWVAGRPGGRYAIEIRNHVGERLLAVTSVDGVNVLSGATAAWDQSGYVFDPWERYEITGWRKSDAEVAAFTFTESPNSYAERTGRPRNVGVIGVALFRERQPPAISGPARIGHEPPRPEPLREQYGPPEALAGSPAAESAPQARAQDSIAPPTRPAPKLGTGHGEREYSYVSHTLFLRMQAQPNEIVRIRYDSLDNLVAMGVIKRYPMPPALNPFPGSPDRPYVPDPPG